MGMAFTSWRMSRGKVYELHLRIHDHEGLHILRLGPNCRPGRGKIRLSFAGIGAWKWLLRPPLPWGWLLLLGGCPWARFMSFICESMANRVSNVGPNACQRRQVCARANFAHRSRNWGMEVTHEASTAMGMAFTSWRMSRGKVYELHLRIHDQQGLHILRLGPNCRQGGAKFAYRFAGIGAWKWPLRPPLPMGMAFTSWGMSMGKVYELHLRIHGQQGL